MSDRRYSTSAWQKTRRAILQRDGYVCQIRGPRCTGRATSVHHVAPSSQRPDLFWDSGNLTAACQTCNAGGGRRIAVENGRSTMLQLAQAIEQLSHRVYALGERVTQLEDAQPEHTNVDTTPVHAVPRIY